MNSKDRILAVSKNEFLRIGYDNASIRQISKVSNLSIGAIYGYFESKELIFNELVDESAERLLEYLDVQMKNNIVNKDSILKMINQFKQDRSIDEDVIDVAVNFFKLLYESRDEYILLFYRSKGTDYENYLQKIIDADVLRTLEIYRFLNNGEEPSDDIKHVFKLIVSGCFNALLKVFETEPDFEKAKDRLLMISAFYWDGFVGFMERKKSN